MLWSRQARPREISGKWPMKCGVPGSPPLRVAMLTIAAVFCADIGVRAADEKPAPTGPVSFYRQVRPVLQRNCTGCHQPAKAGGKLVLTTYAAIKAGGEKGVGFEPGKPDDSLLIEFISGEKPAMPKNAPPLS